MRKVKSFLPFGRPLIEQAEIDEVVASMQAGWLGTGEKVKMFEDLFAKYKGVNYAVAVSSCTAALHLALCAIGIKQGDEVLVPTMTFAATANTVVHAGGTPVFVDCEKDTMCIDPVDLERKITPKTRAIMPVHFAGRACNMSHILDIAKRNGLKVIEDAAHAIETEYQGNADCERFIKPNKKAGAIGDIGCSSFYVTKNITTGEGGMLTTNNKEYAAAARSLAFHGKIFEKGEQYKIVQAGFKYNMTDIQASIGIHQLAKVEQSWQRRQAIWQFYNSRFSGLPVITPALIAPNTRHAYHLYTLLLDIDRLKLTRDEFMWAMWDRGIGTGVHYTALHLHPFYQRLGYKAGDFPNAEYISERTISLPMRPNLTDDEVADVVQAVKGALC